MAWKLLIVYLNSLVDKDDWLQLIFKHLNNLKGIDTGHAPTISINPLTGPTILIWTISIAMNYGHVLFLTGTYELSESFYLFTKNMLLEALQIWKLPLLADYFGSAKRKLSRFTLNLSIFHRQCIVRNVI